MGLFVRLRNPESRKVAKRKRPRREDEKGRRSELLTG